MLKNCESERDDVGSNEKKNVEFLTNSSLERRFNKQSAKKLTLPTLPRLRHMNKLTSEDMESMRYLES